MNRLEKAGHITRGRDSADRRIVTLRVTEGIDGMLDHFFHPLVDRVTAMMENHSPEQLAHAERFITDYVATMNGYIEEVARQNESPSP